MSGTADTQRCFFLSQGHGPADIKWEKYFEDPSLWWDNRATKRTPKQPDFVHKTDRWLPDLENSDPRAQAAVSCVRPSPVPVLLHADIVTHALDPADRFIIASCKCRLYAHG